MEWMIDNWYLMLALLVAIIMVIVTAVKWFGLPTDKQIANIKEWLKLAVVDAEKEMGSGTGQLKLRMVYDMAIQAFPWVAKVVKFETFSEWVDEALVWMELQLNNNRNVYNMVKGDK